MTNLEIKNPMNLSKAELLAEYNKALAMVNTVAKERDEARAVCAVMRKALREIKIRIAYIGMPQEPFWMDGDRKIWDWREQIKLLEAALSTECGKDDQSFKATEIAREALK